jgi:hypothetical protein
VADSVTQPERETRPAGHDPRLSSALLSVKSLVSIVMGLALTHTILTVLTEENDGVHGSVVDGASGPLLSADISMKSILCAAAVVTAIIRFYHGNNQLLESLYGESTATKRRAAPSGGIGVNFIVIMVQSVFFALMSFYVDGSRELIALFGLLLLLDIFWYVANWTTADTDPDALRQQRAWMLNNFGFLIVLGALYYTKNDHWAVTAGAAAILLNTLVDFGLSWKFYFPPIEAEDGLEPAA